MTAWLDTPDRPTIVCLCGIELTASDAARFWAKVAVADPEGCWLWQASLSPKGYGQFKIGGHKGKSVQSHRVAFALSGGVVPDGCQLDHVKARGCTSRACCNPAHLEPVTSRENTLRGDTIPARFATATHCKRGHLLDERNLYPWAPYRKCRECNKMRGRERMRRVRAQQRAA